jgi:hypothetical protein
MIARSFICLATPGRCSLMRTPGAAVAISLKGPPLACPGFKSKVSVWLGPPFIHSKMHDLPCLAAALPAAAAANRGNQPL